MATTRTRAERTDPEVRRQQLVEAAMVAFGKKGYVAMGLQELADEVGVTRNLIHHYFPGGKRELHLEAVDLASNEIVDLLDTDPSAPVERKMVLNITTYVDEALVPTPRYTLFMRSLHSADPEVVAIATEARDRYVDGAMTNHFGSSAAAPPEARAVMAGAIGFMEAVASEWRALGIDDRERLITILVGMTASSMAEVSYR